MVAESKKYTLQNVEETEDNLNFSLPSHCITLITPHCLTESAESDSGRPLTCNERHKCSSKISVLFQFVVSSLIEIIKL